MMSHKFIMQKLQYSHHPVPSEILIDPEKLPIVKIGRKCFPKPARGATKNNE
jgi:hypothetical protein